MKENLKNKKRFAISLAEAGSAYPNNDDELSLHEFEILKTGKYTDPRYGVFEITEGLLYRLKENFERNILGVDVAIDIAHNPSNGAMGWVNELLVKNGSLYMTLRDINSKGLEVLKEKVYKYFSVEFGPFVSVSEDGTELVTHDVLYGVALTNRPVIKGMAPTFLSEDVNHNQFNMDFKKLCENLLSRDIVTKEDKEMVRGFFAELSEEAQEAVKETVDAVEAKPEPEEAKGEVETEDADENNKSEEESSEESEDESGEESEDESDTSGESDEQTPAAGALSQDNLEDVKSLSEDELRTRYSQMLKESRERQINDNVKAVMLSGDNSVGFAKESESDVKSFVATLSQDQFTKFSALMQNVKNVVLGEIGSESVKESKKELSEDEKLKEVERYANQLLSEDKSLAQHEAIERAQKELSHLFN